MVLVVVVVVFVVAAVVGPAAVVPDGHKTMFVGELTIECCKRSCAKERASSFVMLMANRGRSGPCTAI